ncbi:MAG: META domain-containing protein [Methanoregula sp.]|nr:META domain-containing protein [Methanoregula sp.]
MPISRMRKFLVVLTFLVIAAILITGCTSTKPAVQPATTPATQPPTIVVTAAATPALPTQLAGNWVITAMGIQDGTAVIKPQSSQITLKFSADGTVSGNGGCNNYNGPFTVTGTTTPKGQGISIGPLASTKMFCQEYSAQETTYLTILEKAMAYNVDGNQLSITASTGDVLIYQTPGSLVTPKPDLMPG